MQTKSALVEEAVNELIAMLLKVNGDEELEEIGDEVESIRQGSGKSKKSIGGDIETMRPKSNKTGTSSRLGSAVISPTSAALKRKREMKDYLYEEAQELLSYFNHRNVDAIVRVTKTTLDALRKRVTVTSSLHYSETGLHAREINIVPLFLSHMTLCIPHITMQPALDEIQQILNKVAQKVINVSRSIRQWQKTCKIFMKSKISDEEEDIFRSRSVSNATSIDEDARDHLRRVTKSETDSSEVSGLTSFIKMDNYYKQVSENKEIAKLCSILSTLINSTKKEVTTALEYFNNYNSVWKLNRQEELEKFLQDDTGLSEFEAIIYFYEDLEKKIIEEPETYNVGAVALYTGIIFTLSRFLLHLYTHQHHVCCR